MKVNKDFFSNIISYLPVAVCLFLLAISVTYISNYRDVWYALTITFCVDFFYNKRYLSFKFNKIRIYYSVVFLFFCLFFIYQPFENSSTYSHLLLRNRICLSGLALCGFLGLNNKHKLSYYLNTIIISAVASIIYLVFFKIGFLSFWEAENKMAIFTPARIEFINNHMVYNVYMNLAIISIWYIVSNQYKMLQKWKLGLYILSFIFIFGVLSISEGRSGFLMSLFIISCICLREVWKRNKYVTLIVIGILSIFVYNKVTHHQRISEEQIKGEPRLFLWETAKEVIMEAPILGRGANDAQEAFNKARTESLDETFKHFWQPTDFVDSHNQYIQTTMEFGIIGLCLLLFIYFSPYFFAEKRRKIFSFFVITILAFQSVFDMFITGQFVNLFMVCTFMILQCRDDISPKDNHITKL